ncbi:sigma 54-interacting transcriptional regulator [Sandaracinus amylolyticus]|uniref:sigma 54-interacting transcriptional regulator n=1 Tax=Sandaracinus amylolyticus TaxID=927083 RepID=UPI001EFF8474|nr:sigma 54-interacting transcriptional regulator [Sandaracinus amylolyticus]
MPARGSSVFEDDGTVRAPRKPPRRVRTVRARVVRGPDAGAEASCDAGATLAIGTSEGNELRLRDPTVSRYHVELAAMPEGIRVRDLASSNGTIAGAVRIESAIVAAGTELRLGDTVLVVDDGAEREVVAREIEPAAIPGVIAESAAMRAVVRALHRIAPTSASVLLLGETGTGKEVIARAIHALSPRRDRELVVVDCGSMAPTLIASELFGHERGAFTGADRRHLGAFERADGGTVFLDEIGELPAELQPALLGVLERRRFRRVGGEREIAVDVRVVAATHRDLREATNAGSFRADLYFRLAAARLVLPPLRDRPEDVEPLARHFAAQLTGDPAAMPFDATSLDALRRHPFAGNVRELRNVVESALAFGELHLDDAAPRAASSASGAQGTALQVDLDRSYREARAAALDAFERAYLGALIAGSRNNASEAARRAKMDRAYLLELLKKHGLR